MAVVLKHVDGRVVVMADDEGLTKPMFRGSDGQWMARVLDPDELAEFTQVEGEERAKLLEEARSSPAPYKVQMTKQARMFMQGLDDEEQGELLDVLGKLSRGEIEGEPLTPEEVERLRVEEGIDLEASLREALSSEDDEAS